MSATAWAAVVCAALAGLLGWRPRRHPALARLDGVPARAKPAAGARRGPGREHARRRLAVVGLAERFAAELEAGAEPRTALVAAARGSPELSDVAAAAAAPAGDVAAALRTLAPGGGDAAVDLALLWEVGETSGAALAAPARRLAAGLRDDEQVRREVAAQLAGPRATAWLLAGLPLVGLAMGAALGARPWAVLASPFGLLLAGPGALLELAGLLWTRTITRRVLAD